MLDTIQQWGNGPRKERIEIVVLVHKTWETIEIVDTSDKWTVAESAVSVEKKWKTIEIVDTIERWKTIENAVPVHKSWPEG